MDENTRELLAWSTHKGIFKVNRLPYGTKPACQIFQNILEKVLLGCKGCINFLDDILVTGKNFKEHIENLKEYISIREIEKGRFNFKYKKKM